MGCPTCGSSRRTALAPGLFVCQAERVELLPNPYDITGALCMPRHPLYWTCSTTYQENAPEVTTEQVCPADSLFAIGLCTSCRNVPICGMCQNWECTGCLAAAAARAAEAQRVADERRRVEQSERDEQARVAAETRAREEAQHDKLVADRHRQFGGTAAVRERVDQLERIERRSFSGPPPAGVSCLGAIGLIVLGFLSYSALIAVLTSALGITPGNAEENLPLAIGAIIVAAAPGLLISAWVATGRWRYQRNERTLRAELAKHRRILTWCGDPTCTRCRVPSRSA